MSRVHNVLALFAQLSAPSMPHEACRALLVAENAAGTWLSLFERTDRDQVQSRALKVMGWLRAADEHEFSAALAACPELHATFTKLTAAAS